ncbi:MAG: hypothetical protein KC609_11700, partial [Myxococcales bacterium]|nr:hypothetical protein [Myxococcales bacterium]
RLAAVFLLPRSMNSGVVALYLAEKGRVVVARLPEGIGSRGDLHPVDLSQVPELRPFRLTTAAANVHDLRFGTLPGGLPSLDFEIRASTPHDPSQTSSFSVSCRFRFAKVLAPALCVLERGELRTQTPCEIETLRVRKVRSRFEHGALSLDYSYDYKKSNDEDDCGTAKYIIRKNETRHYRARWDAKELHFAPARRVVR